MDSIFELLGPGACVSGWTNSRMPADLRRLNANVSVMYKTLFCYTLFFEICAKDIYAHVKYYLKFLRDNTNPIFGIVPGIVSV